MKPVLFALFAAAFAQAQTAAPTVTLTGPASFRPGATVTLSLSATGAAGAADTGAAGFQWTIGMPTAYTATIAPGAAATAANKTILSCSADASLCLLVGMNTTVTGNGALAIYTLKVPLTATAGPVQFPLSGLIAASPTAAALPAAAGTPYAPTVLLKQDLNGDGKVDVTDLQMMIAEVIASQASPAACKDDMNSDGKCDLLDVIQILLRALSQ